MTFDKFKQKYIWSLSASLTGLADVRRVGLLQRSFGGLGSSWCWRLGWWTPKTRIAAVWRMLKEQLLVDWYEQSQHCCAELLSVRFSWNGTFVSCLEMCSFSFLLLIFSPTIFSLASIRICRSFLCNFSIELYDTSWIEVLISAAPIGQDYVANASLA